MESSQTLQGQQLDQNIKTNAMVNDAVTAALATKDDNQLQSVVLQQAARLQAAGFPSDRIHGALLNLSSDPAQLRQQLESIRVATLPTEQRQQVIHGEPFTYTAPGGAMKGGTRDPRTGIVSAPDQSGVQPGLSAEQAAERTKWLQSPRDYPDPANPNVQKHGTNETFLRDSGVPDQYIYPGGAPASPGSQASPLGTGRPPPALLNPNKPPAAPAPAASPAGSGITGPTPEQTAEAEATRKQGELGPPLFQKEVDAGTAAQNQQAVLGNMLVDTSQFTTGPLAGVIGKVRNMAGNLGLNINTDAQSAKESFAKLAAGLANAQGAGSDARMNVNMAANPHEELSPAGVDLILRQLQGNADYIRARATLAAKYPDKAKYPAFQESVKELDPRVFQLARMTQPQRDTYWKSLDDTTQKQLGAAIKKAKELGVLGG